MNSQVVDIRRSFLIVETGVGGHRAVYINHLINYWSHHHPGSRLDILVVPGFIDKYGDTLGLTSMRCGITFHVISTDDLLLINKYNSPMIRGFTLWNVVQKWINFLHPDSCILMQIDSFQLAIATNLNDRISTQLSGIYFAPTFHYPMFGQSHFSLREKLKGKRQEVIISAMLKRSSLKTLFCLDPYVCEALKSDKLRNKMRHLPDPTNFQVLTDDRIEACREKYNIQANQFVILLFGVIERRKGVLEALNALQQINEELQAKLTVIFAGLVEKSIKESFQESLTEMRNTTNVNIVVINEYLSDEDSYVLLQTSDAVLAPYQRQPGSSGLLMQAAAAGKPIICSDYGLLGKLVRENSLGLLINSEKPDSIAAGITTAMTEPLKGKFNLAKVSDFVTSHTPEKFAETIFKYA